MYVEQQDILDATNGGLILSCIIILSPAGFRNQRKKIQNKG